MMRPSKPWSRPCSARSSIDDSSETLVARIEDAEFDPTQLTPLLVAKISVST